MNQRIPLSDTGGGILSVPGTGHSQWRAGSMDKVIVSALY